MISAKKGSLYMGFSGVYMVIRKLDVRTYNDPHIGGISLQHATHCRIENVTMTSGVYNVQAARPRHCKAVLLTPGTKTPPLPSCATCWSPATTPVSVSVVSDLRRDRSNS